MDLHIFVMTISECGIRIVARPSYDLYYVAKILIQILIGLTGAQDPSGPYPATAIRDLPHEHRGGPGLTRLWPAAVSWQANAAPMPEVAPAIKTSPVQGLGFAVARWLPACGQKI